MVLLVLLMRQDLLMWLINMCAGAGTEGGLCPQAHYCPLGSVLPLPCPAGTYNNLTGQFECSLCHAGYYCPESTSNYTKFPCPPGFYCPDGIAYNTVNLLFTC